MNHCTGLQGKRCSCGEWHEFDDFDPSKPNVLATLYRYGRYGLAAAALLVVALSEQIARWLT